jgi:hypothetical protein
MGAGDGIRTSENLAEKTGGWQTLDYADAGKPFVRPVGRVVSPAVVESVGIVMLVVNPRFLRERVAIAGSWLGRGRPSF